MTYEQIKRKHKIEDSDVAEWFGYSSADSLRNTTKFVKIKQGIEQIYSRFSSDKEEKKEEVKEIINKEIGKI